ncbi:cytochrome c3 family protein [Shewanella algae]|uniref:cytochrome c3 family protein n=1 Tax=Shewanella algae TaxID=38313 RepID=UPI0031F5AD9B
MLRNKLLVALVLTLLPVIGFAKGDFLADRHKHDNDIKCNDCHNEMPPKNAPEKESCLSCHGSYEELGKRTENVIPNPHDNHMTGGGCTDCHSGHKLPTLMCDSCHELDMNIK